MNWQKTVDTEKLHQKEAARETAGDLYRHAPLPYYLTREGQKERDGRRGGEFVRRIKEAMADGK
jgi:hypothetical protein